jgi:hypothetical protein
MDECGTNGANAKPKSNGREEPSWTDDFAAYVGWNLKDDIRDVENRQDFVVVVSGQVKILFESHDLGVTYG